MARQASDGLGGDVAGFEAVVEAHEGALLRYASHLLAGQAHHDAQDVVQDALLRLHRQTHGGGEEVTHVRAWLLRVTHNLVMDTVRKRQSRRKQRQRLHEQATAEQPTRADPSTALAGLEKREAAEAARRLMQDLPEIQQRVLYLKLTEDLTLRQIGEVLEMSFGSVNHQLGKALKTLAQQLKAKDYV